MNINNVTEKKMNIKNLINVITCNIIQFNINSDSIKNEQIFERLAMTK